MTEATEHTRHFSRTRLLKISPAFICIPGGREDAWRGCGGNHPGHYLHKMLPAPGHVASRMHQPQVCSLESIPGDGGAWLGRERGKEAEAEGLATQVGEGEDKWASG